MGRLPQYLFAYLLVLGSPALGAQPALSGPSEVQVMVGSGELADDGGVWFNGAWGNVRFSLPAGRNARGDELWRIVKKADGAKRQLKVRFDAAAGRVDEKDSLLVYPICAVSLDEEWFVAAGKCGASKGKGSSPEQDLVVGWALGEQGLNAEGRARLDRALAAKTISPTFRLLALKTRANLLESLGDELPPLSDESDRALAAALADYRALAELEPNESQHQLDIASQLEALGNYAAAADTYRQVLKKWPDEEYRANISLSAIERRKGNYDEALQYLNGVSLKNPVGAGMRFYYHRGMTLTKLKRYDEAAADFSEGLKDQPDYAWAFTRRACALGQLGQLKPALNDVESALAKLRQYPGQQGQDFKHNVARLDAIDIQLKAAVASGSATPTAAACEGFWHNEDARSPSKYLVQ